MILKNDFRKRTDEMIPAKQNKFMNKYQRRGKKTTVTTGMTVK